MDSFSFTFINSLIFVKDFGDTPVTPEVPDTSTSATYVFSSYQAGTQYADNEKHELDNNTSVITKPTNGVIKNSTKTSYGFTYKEGIYPVNTVNVNYEGTCELQVRETTSSTSRSVYYYKWNFICFGTIRR